MATKTELVEKARLAKSAKLSGQVDEFIRASRQTNASTPAVKAPSAGQPAAPSLFAKLHRGRIPDAADDPVKEVAKTAPIAVLPTAVEATVPPAPRSAFAALARGRIPDNPDGGGRSCDENTGTSTSYAPAPRRPMASVNSDGARPAGKSSQFAALSRSRNQPQSNGSFARPRVSNDPAWGEPDIPAGSSYTPAQWLEARADGHCVCVVEVRNAAGESSLVRAPRHYDETSRQVLLGIEHVEVRDEDLDVDEGGQLSSLFVTTWDGCLLLEPSAPTTHPGAIRTELVLRPGGDASRGIKHKVVRPESCREKLHWLWGVKEWFDQHPDSLRLTSHLRPRSTPG